MSSWVYVLCLLLSKLFHLSCHAGPLISAIIGTPPFNRLKSFTSPCRLPCFYWFDISVLDIPGFSGVILRKDRLMIHFSPTVFERKKTKNYYSGILQIINKYLVLNSHIVPSTLWNASCELSILIIITTCKMLFYRWENWGPAKIKSCPRSHNWQNMKPDFTQFVLPCPLWTLQNKMRKLDG